MRLDSNRNNKKINYCTLIFILLVFCILCISVYGIYYFLFAPDSPPEIESFEILPPGPVRTPREVLQELGSSTWKLLHTLVENLPQHPSPIDKRRLLSLFHALESLFPHEESKETWRLVSFTSSAPDLNVATQSRDHLAAWLCGFHNDVNAWLSKPPRSCEPKALSASYSLQQDPGQEPRTPLDFGDPSRSVLQEIIDSASGPCAWPISHTLFTVQHDPVSGGFSFPHRRFGKGRVTVVLFTTSSCSFCMSQLVRLSAMRQQREHSLNLLAIFEWNPSIPARDDRTLIKSQLDAIQNIPTLFESHSGEGSLYHHLLKFENPKGVPYALVYQDCSLQKIFNQDNLLTMYDLINSLLLSSSEK